MAARSLWAWFSGYVIIKVTGGNLEECINLAAGHGVDIWDAQMAGPGHLVCRMTLDGYREFRPVLRDKGYAVSIVSSGGIPFVAASLASRKALIAGLFLFVLGIYLLSSVVWSIKVTGLETVSPADVHAVLREMGIRVGVPRSSVDTDAVRGLLERSLSGIAWAGVELKGTSLMIEIAEKTFPEPKAAPSNLVAAADGVITRLITLVGQPMAAEGDTVREGQILIKATPESDARGIVMARVWHEGSSTVPLAVVSRVRTGRASVLYVFRIANVSMVLGKRPRFAAYDTERTVSAYQLGRSGNVTVEIVSLVYHELNLVETRITSEEGFSMARSMAMTQAMQGVPDGARVQSCTEHRHEVDGQSVTVRVVVEALWDIGRLDCDKTH